MAQIDISKINEDFYEFIKRNEDSDVSKLRLKKMTDSSFDVELAITQIECRKKIKKKLPDFYNTKFLFPSILSTEQCTCEIVAKFHAEIVGRNSSLLDMTSGLGIDDYYMSKFSTHITALELNKDIADISQFNMASFAQNITVINCNSEGYINSNMKAFDAIFIDPARRGDNNCRLFGIKDCEPNIVPLLPKIREHTDVLYVKASPMIDLTESLRELQCVTDVWVVSLKNECKELFFKINFTIEANHPTKIHCVNFMSEQDKQELCYTYEQNKRHEINYADEVKSYLYEPNASIMKVGAFAPVAQKFDLDKIADNSHLFTSDTFHSDFPGRAFKVINTYPFKDKILKAALRDTSRMNVSVRNFKLSAENLKQRLKLKDGGDKYLFGTTLRSEEMVVIVCEKANG